MLKEGEGSSGALKSVLRKWQTTEHGYAGSGVRWRRKRTDGLGENKGVREIDSWREEKQSLWQQVQTQAWTRGSSAHKWVTDLLSAAVSGNDKDKVWHRNRVLDNQEQRRKSTEMRRARDWETKAFCGLSSTSWHHQRGLRTWGRAKCQLWEECGFVFLIKYWFDQGSIPLKKLKISQWKLSKVRHREEKKISEKKSTDSQWPVEQNQEVSYIYWGPKRRIDQKGTKYIYIF